MDNNGKIKMMPGERLYASAAALTAGLILLLIVLGAMVRLLEAERACGSTWPLCDGAIIPQTGNERVWIDWGHRLLTMLTVIATLSTFYIARRFVALLPFVIKPIYLGLSLLIVQSLLGAATMRFSDPSTLPLLHLSLAVILFSCLIASLTASLYQPYHSLVLQLSDDDTFPDAVHSATLMTFMVLMTGALIVGGGVSDACEGFPICREPFTENAAIHLIHRGGVLLLGIILLTFIWRVRSERPHDTISSRIVFTFAGLYLTQAILGAVYVQLGRNPGISALHVMFAGLTWAAAVALSMTMIKQKQKLQNEKLQHQLHFEKPCHDELTTGV